MYGGMGAQTGLTISTHSRAKAAGRHVVTIDRVLEISTHSRAKAAGRQRRGGR